MLFASAAIGGPRVALAELGDISDMVFGGEASATLELANTGDINSQTNADGSLDVGDWVSPKAFAGANYEAQVTVNSGTLSSGTTGSWLALSSSRSWNVTQSIAGTKTANITVEIRSAISSVVLATATINLSAEFSS